MPRPSGNKLHRFVFSLPFLVLLAALTVVVVVSAVNMYQTKRDTQQVVERLEEQKQELLAREDTVTNAALDISTERGLEEEIREKFSVAKEGERVIVLVDQEEGSATSTDQEQSWWQRLFSSLWPF